jgi:hypothetical protein
MRKIILPVLLASLLSACGAMPISDTDKKDIRTGEKALLVTNNRQLSDYLFIIPIFLDAAFGAPNQINITHIDGEEVENEWKRVNQRIVLEPGEHEIQADCSVEITDMNRDVNDRSGDDIQWSTDYIKYTFEGGKKYRIVAREYINGSCKIDIKPK